MLGCLCSGPCCASDRSQSISNERRDFGIGAMRLGPDASIPVRTDSLVDAISLAGNHDRSWQLAGDTRNGTDCYSGIPEWHSWAAAPCGFSSRRPLGVGVPRLTRFVHRARRLGTVDGYGTGVSKGMENGKWKMCGDQVIPF